MPLKAVPLAFASLFVPAAVVIAASQDPIAEFLRVREEESKKIFDLRSAGRVEESFDKRFVDRIDALLPAALPTVRFRSGIDAKARLVAYPFYDYDTGMQDGCVDGAFYDVKDARRGTGFQLFVTRKRLLRAAIAYREKRPDTPALRAGRVEALARSDDIACENAAHDRFSDVAEYEIPGRGTVVAQWICEGQDFGVEPSDLVAFLETATEIVGIRMTAESLGVKNIGCTYPSRDEDFTAVTVPCFRAWARSHPDVDRRARQRLIDAFQTFSIGPAAATRRRPR